MRARAGEIEQAYGFDLSPIVPRAEEFKSLAEVVRNERKAFKVARERLTLLRRGIVKMIDMGIDKGVSGAIGAACIRPIRRSSNSFPGQNHAR
ncbi:hypothetical protein GCM10011499_07790 [Pelagibacterium lentulum]|uniref:Plasmid replication protein C N-terminal domain-containing protein n=1 Tax=Pelagibacterium lentulum TaxID=2029865 RepID=A0A916RAG8_9HYPH|nr:hypothetical protein GCM10011499_07790 [Pelagibacterium lentulum]